jgi:hypothetical protein
MFRAIVLSLALTVAGGPGAALACSLSYGSQPAGASGCHDEGPTGGTAMRALGCDHAIFSLQSFLPEQERQVAQARPEAEAGAILSDDLTGRSDASPGSDRSHAASLEKQLLTTILRI